MKIAVTGHRPPRLKGQEEDIYIWFEEQISMARLMYGKIDEVYCGMAQGADQIFYRAAANSYLRINCCYPWKKKDMDFIEQAALGGTTIAPMLTRIWLYDQYPGKKGYIERDRYMVDHCDVLLAVWDGVEEGGTWDTIKYAREKGRPIIYYGGLEYGRDS